MIILYCFILCFSFVTTVLHACGYEPQESPCIDSQKPVASYGGPLPIDDYNIELHGYIKPELFYDTRRIFGQRQGHTLLFPLPPLCDADGRDIHERATFHMLPIESRIRLTIDTIPKFFCSKLSGMFEVDLAGGPIINNRSEHNVGQSSFMVLRARHAFIRFEWERTTLLLGQYYHPFSIEGLPSDFMVTVFAGICDPYARSPQIRLSHYFSKHVECIVAASGQLDFVSNGPDGSSSMYLRRALVPNLNAQIRIHWSESQQFGIAFDFKRLVPRDRAVVFDGALEKLFKVGNGFNSYSALAFINLQYHRFDWWLKITYGENLSDQLMLGSYAVVSRDPRNGQEEYAPMASVGLVTDMYLKYEVEPGIHIGYVKHVGLARKKCLFQDPNKSADDPTRFIIYGFGNPDDDSYLFNRISSEFMVLPRIKWHVKPFTLGVELEYVRAHYGTMTETGKIIRSRPVHVLRGTIAAFYFF